MTQSPAHTVEKTGRLQMILAMILSGTIGYFVLESGQDTWNIVFFRCLFGAGGLALYCAFTGLFKKWPFTKRTFFLALCGGAALVMNWVLLFSSYRHVSISVATALYHIQPFFLVLFGIVLFREKPGIHRWLWLILAFMGLLFVIRLDFTGLSFSSTYLLGLAQAIGAAFLYAVATILAKQLKNIRPHLLALVQVTLGIVLLFPFAHFSDLPTQGQPWVFMVSLGLVHTCIMYIIMYAAFQKLPTSIIAILSFIYPAVAIFVDYVAYGQRLSIGQIVGTLMIFVGVAGVNLNWRIFDRKASSPAP